MKATLALACCLLGCGTVLAERFDGHQHDILDLGGRTLSVEEIG